MTLLITRNFANEACPASRALPMLIHSAVLDTCALLPVFGVLTVCRSKRWLPRCSHSLMSFHARARFHAPAWSARSTHVPTCQRRYCTVAVRATTPTRCALAPAAPLSIRCGVPQPVRAEQSRISCARGMARRAAALAGTSVCTGGAQPCAGRGRAETPDGMPRGVSQPSSVVGGRSSLQRTTRIVCDGCGHHGCRVGPVCGRALVC